LRGRNARRRALSRAGYIAKARDADLRDVVFAVLPRADRGSVGARGDRDGLEIGARETEAIGDGDSRAGDRRNAQMVEGDAFDQSQRDFVVGR